MRLLKMTDTHHNAPMEMQKTATGERTALEAWAASLPLALFPPAAFWILSVAVVSPMSVLFGMVVGAVSCAVHFVSYLFTGLPVFLWIFRKPESLVWRLPVSLVTGVVCGSGVVVIQSLKDGASLSVIPSPPLIVCGLYGLITAASAYRQRPCPETGQIFTS
jgi:hypothetical protein